MSDDKGCIGEGVPVRDEPSGQCSKSSDEASSGLSANVPNAPALQAIWRSTEIDPPPHDHGCYRYLVKKGLGSIVAVMFWSPKGSQREQALGERVDGFPWLASVFPNPPGYPIKRYAAEDTFWMELPDGLSAT